MQVCNLRSIKRNTIFHSQTRRASIFQLSPFSSTPAPFVLRIKPRTPQSPTIRPTDPYAANNPRTPLPQMSGTFAVHKPAGVSSATFMETVQRKLEADPEFINTNMTREERQKRKRRKMPKVKMGHGGTLDPAADGVLVLGVNEGTKKLGEYLNCSKTYDVIAHFGCSTTTYDAEGSVLDRASTADITKDNVEQVLEHFRGEIQQMPPIYSALKVGGSKLYEYARNLESLPRNISPRPVTIHSLEIVGDISYSHEYLLPVKEATVEEKFQERVFRDAGLKELVKLGNRYAEMELKSLEQQSSSESATGEESLATGAEPNDADTESKLPGPLTTAAGSVECGEHPAENSESEPEQPVAEHQKSTTAGTEEPHPVVTIRATVSSGTYIRSLVHDIAIAIGTRAHVAKLTRTRQGDWEVGKNVIPADDIEAKELSEWAPKAKFFMKNGPLEEFAG
ncbi:pseudouridine synthase [Lipomyces orientalis]|uniref:Pseudouridine synthase n=1 Tax=Lipomyces orientalis TaxID=1233043 RepID=A0ACC3TQ76_9ASCO